MCAPHTLPCSATFAHCYPAPQLAGIRPVPAALCWLCDTSRVELRTTQQKADPPGIPFPWPRSLATRECSLTWRLSRRERTRPICEYAETVWSSARKKFVLPRRRCTPAAVGADTRTNPHVRATAAPKHKNWLMFALVEGPSMTIAPRKTAAGRRVRNLKNAELRLAVSVT